MTSFNEVFESVKDYCRTTKGISEVAINTWFNAMQPVDLDESKAIFSISTEFQKNLIIKNYEEILKEAFLNTIGFNVEIIIKVENEDMERELYQAEEKKAELNTIFEGAKYEYTFDTFIVGSSNEFAYAACTAVANSNNAASTYNPLFIHGPSGLGKTHLLTAIAHQAKKNNPNISIVYVSGETFTNEVIEAISTKTTMRLRMKYRNADLLLMDDVQFIAGKTSTQEEFFHTFNELHQFGKQIVLTSDRPPKDIKTLEDRIKSRFEWGLMADISIPEFETRVAIIKRKAELLDLQIPDDVVEHIATKLKSNIRQLEGAVKKLKAAKHLLGTTMTVAMAQSIIKDILTDSQPAPITVENIITEVASIYNVTGDDIRSGKRTGQISTARKVAIYVVREITGLSQDAIGKEFGGRDHSTVVYALNSIESAIKKDQNLKEIIDDIVKNIRNK